MIPNCCVLIGVPDQYGYLESGEIFVQIRKDSFIKKDAVADDELSANKKDKILKELKGDKESEILEGEVLVTKNPCSHPGDI